MLERVVQRGSEEGNECDVVVARLIERDLLDVVESICAREHARSVDVLGKVRRSSVVRVRRLVWAWCKTELRMSNLEIGELFGVDESTARAGVLAVHSATRRAS